MKNFYLRHKEVILYLIYGGFTTLISILSYALLRLIFGVKTSQIISWIAAVIFAYFTNKIFVFEAKNKEKKKIIVEFLLFLSARLFSGVLEFVLIAILIKETTPKITELIFKVAVTGVVIVLNYIFSKFIIFKNKENKKDKELNSAVSR